MALDSEKIRSAIRPQDSMSIAITLLGVAIALFLDDAIIRLIGGCIALLGGVALYMTVRQRLDDQVQIQTRRTTLPPPNFKTRVTTDPGSSTRRIHFDDFQEAFNTGDEDAGDEAAVTPARPSRPARREDVAAPRPSISTAHRRFDDEELDGSDVDGAHSFNGGDDGSFTILRPGTQSTDPVPATVRPAPEARPTTRTLESSATSFTPERGERAPAGSSVPRAAGSTEAPATADTDVAPLPPMPATTKPTEPISQAPSVPEPAAADAAAAAPIVPTEAEPEARSGRKQVQMILEDLAAEDGDEDRGSEPRAEFVRLVGQVLNAVARSMSARSIVFCWVNLQKQHLIPEARLTTGDAEIRTGARIPIGADVVSQIARNGIPEILTDISKSAERELIPYYAAPAQTRSFVGVPVFFRREVVGVLAADSGELNAFDEGAVATLAEYTRLIAGLIRGYTEKYDLQLTARTLESFERMQEAFAGAALPPQQIGRVVVEQAAQLFDHEYITAVLFDEESREWRPAAASDPRGIGIAAWRPAMDASVVGYVTQNAQEMLIDAVDREMVFSSDERLQPGGGLMAMPLVGTTRCYGAIIVGHTAPNAYIPRDLDLLRDLARYAAMAIEVYNVNNAIDAQSVVDEVTGAYTGDFLRTLLERESRRARDFRKPLCYALVAVDIPHSLRDAVTREMEEVIAATVGDVLSAASRPYDAVGRVESRCFGVVLVERNDQDAYLWAEKLRKEVASRIMSVGGRKFSVTVSIGICDLSDLDGPEAMVAGARQALERARTGDGNAVILY